MSNPRPALLIFDQRMKEERDYWVNQHSSDVEESNLFQDFPRPSSYSPQLGSIEFNITGRLHERLIEITGDGSFLLYTTLMVALKVYLHRSTGSTRIVVGSPARKAREGDAHSPNALAIIDQVHDGLTCRNLLMAVRQTLLDAYAKQQYPYERLVKDLGLASVVNRCALFDTALILKDIHGPLPDVKNDVTLTFEKTEGRIAANIEFNSALFKEETMRRFVDHFVNLLEELVKNTDAPIWQLTMCCEAEHRHIVSDWNQTDAPFQDGVCAHELFEAQARQTPSAIAAVFEDRELTYRELNRRANQLGRYLQLRGVGVQALIGICMEPSLDLLVAVLGVNKAGAAFVPLDPSYPAERLAFMLDDAAVKVLLSKSHLMESVAQTNVTRIDLDADWDLISRESNENLSSLVGPNDLAYVIYTSGSTGRAKAVLLEHRALCNLAEAQRRAFHIKPESRVLQFASFSFDASISEIFVTLLSGATLFLGSRDSLMPGPGLLRLLRDRAITAVTLPPSVLAVLPEADLPDLQTLVVAGEACPADLVTRWGKGRRFINAYGPTEGTVCATLTECADTGESPLIGRPIANTRIYLLDEWLQPAAIGLPGEIHIGGVGVARGYLGRADLTAESFIPDPFTDKPGARMYRTGDLARYRPSGDVDYIGRRDHQVKIRGFRIELGEVTEALRGHPDLKDAVVISREDEPGNKRLVGYVVPRGETDPSAAVIRSYLRERLPDYMTPAAFVVMKSLPLTPSGKLDRRALPAPELPGSDRDAAATESPVVELLMAMWSQVLGVKKVGLNDDFFELGGHSLSATQLISRVVDAFQIELPLLRLFEAPTVSGLAAEVEKALKGSSPSMVPPIVKVSREGDLPLSFAQQRLWFLNQLEPDIPFYHICAAVRLKGDLKVAALGRSLGEVIKRHEALRTVFVSVCGKASQVIVPPSDCVLPVIDISALAESSREAEARNLITRQSLRPFDLSSGPVVRATLLRLGAEEHGLVLTMHHIVSDGWSIGLLTEEIATLYEAFTAGEPSPLADLPIQYADFAHWQREWLQGEVLEAQLAYWRTKLGGNLPVLQLPTDRPRSSTQAFRGGRRSFLLSKELSQELKQLSKRESVTQFMTLLAAFKTLLYRYSGQEDIVVGSPIANRTRVETERLIGFFVNTLVLRTDLSGNPTFRALLKRVREVTLGAYMHQDVPFEKLVEELQPARDLSKQALFQVVFVAHNTPMQVRELPGLTRSSIGSEVGSAVFDVIMNTWDTDEGIVCSMEFNPDLFNIPTVDRLLEHYRVLLGNIAADPDARLDDLEMLSEEERTLLEKPIVINDFDQGFAFYEQEPRSI